MIVAPQMTESSLPVTMGTLKDTVRLGEPVSSVPTLFEQIQLIGQSVDDWLRRGQGK